MIALGLLFALFLKMRQPLLLAPLLVSPGLFVVFWVVDGQGAFRKEIIAYVAVLLAVWACAGKHPAAVVASALILCIAVYGHEANVLLLPLFLGVLWIFRAQVSQVFTLWLAAGIAVLGSLSGFLYAYMHRHVDETSLVCAPLLQRGLDPEICKGAITWLGVPIEQTGTIVATRYLTLPGMASLVLIYILLLLPVFYALRHMTRQKQMVLLVLLSAVPFLPLYPIATDWGRWISLHAFCMLVVIMAALFSGYATVRRAPDPKVVIGLMSLSLLWAPNHMLGIEWFWPINTVATLTGTLR